MDKRDFILELLENFQAFDKEEEKSRQEIMWFVHKNERCFENDFQLGHVTGSAFVIDRNIESTLLTHHAKLNKWLQFGGHSDGHWNPLEVGWREAHEESGLTSLEYLPIYDGVFDVDVHSIPARGEMPEHKHYDIRILLVADMDEPYKTSNESNELKLVLLEKAHEYYSQPDFLRMVKKVDLIRESL